MQSINEFLGREDILTLLRKRADGMLDGYRQNIALIGPERIGKTSVLLNLFKNIDSSRFIIIYIDFKPGQFPNFVNKFIASVFYNFTKNKDEINGLNFPTLVNNTRPFIPKTVDLLAKINDDLKNKKYSAVFSKILDSLDLIGKETGKPIIFAIDEFHNLDSSKLKNIFAELGKMIMVQKNIMYVLLSSAEEKSMKIICEKLNLLFGNFEIIKVGPFNYQTSLSFIRRRLKGIELSKRLENFVIACTGGNPFYLETICSEIQNVYLKTSIIPYDPQQLVVDTYRNLLFNQHGIFSQYFANRLMSISHKYSGIKLVSILMVIANKNTRLREIAKLMRSSVKETQQRLDKLVEIGMLYKNGVFYQFCDKIFSFWLKFVYQKRISDLGWDMGDKEKEFVGELLNYIDKLEGTIKQPLRERFIELFDSFDNELVQIEDRRLKLPRFKKLDFLDQSSDVICLEAKGEDTCWLISINKNFATENKTIEFVNRIKDFPKKFNKKIIVNLNGMDVNACLLAKENKISIWDIDGVNLLLDIFGKERILTNENISIG